MRHLIWGERVPLALPAGRAADTRPRRPSTCDHDSDPAARGLVGAWAMAQPGSRAALRQQQRASASSPRRVRISPGWAVLNDTRRAAKWSLKPPRRFASSHRESEAAAPLTLGRKRGGTGPGADPTPQAYPWLRESRISKTPGGVGPDPMYTTWVTAGATNELGHRRCRVTATRLRSPPAPPTESLNSNELLRRPAPRPGTRRPGRQRTVYGPASTCLQHAGKPQPKPALAGTTTSSTLAKRLHALHQPEPKLYTSTGACRPNITDAETASCCTFTSAPPAAEIATAARRGSLGPAALIRVLVPAPRTPAPANHT